jgi:Glyoxalase-like domain
MTFADATADESASRTPVQAARDALDHLLIGAATLENGIGWLEERTGVRAMVGGSHPGLGTWNALASLGPGQYIEILAPDPAQPGVGTFYVPGLRDFAAPRIATWAARSVDLARGFPATLPHDFSCEPARAGARIRPDGTRLAWTLAFPRHREHLAFDGALPFFIEWGSYDDHPGKSTPPGLTLHALRFSHPEPGSLESALAALGIDGAVKPAAQASIEVELDTPRGRVVL